MPTNNGDSAGDDLHKPERRLCFSFYFVFVFLCRTEFFSRNQRQRCFLRLIHQNSFEAMVLWMDIGTCSHSFVKFLLWSNWSRLLFLFIIIFCGIEANCNFTFSLCFISYDLSLLKLILKDSDFCCIWSINWYWFSLQN